MAKWNTIYEPEDATEAILACRMQDALEEIEDYLRIACTASKVTTTHECLGETTDPLDCPYILVDGYLHIMAEWVTVKTIKGDRQRLGFRLEEVIAIPQTREEPEDTDFNTLGIFESPSDAARAAILALVAHCIDAGFTHKAESEMADAYLDD